MKREFECVYYDGDENYGYFGYDCFLDQEEYPLSYDYVTAMVAELFPCHVKRVKTLEEIAMKTVLKHRISMEEMSRELKKRSVLLVHGQNSIEDEDDGTEEDVYMQADYDEYQV